MKFTDEDKLSIRGLIADEFADEITKGYVLEGPTDVSDQVLEQRVDLELVNPRIDRTIRFSLLAHQGRNSLNISMLKPSGGLFSLYEYLVSKGGSDSELQKLDFATYGGSLPQRAALVIRHASRLLSTDLARAVSGEEWPDVPIDWGQMR
jgi:hypothetical protein